MNKTLESIQSTPNQLAAVEAPVRAQLIKELPPAQKEQAIGNLVESAMIMVIYILVESLQTLLGLLVQIILQSIQFLQIIGAQ